MDKKSSLESPSNNIAATCVRKELETNKVLAYLPESESGSGDCSVHEE